MTATVNPATATANKGKAATIRHKTKTVTIGGRRVKLTSNGRTTTAKPAPELEWRLQHAQVKALRAMPEYGTQFLLAAGMEAGKRGKLSATIAKATGLEPGEPDLKIYMTGARILFIENKAENGKLSKVQELRHDALRKLGHRIEVIKAATCEEAASLAVGMVRVALKGKE